MRYTFDGKILDIERRELRRGTDQVRVTPQAFDLLEYLIRNRERVVTKDELVAAVWGGRAISDSALTTRMNVLRRIIGDSGEQQRFIGTVVRKGFRFVGAVREEQPATARFDKGFSDPSRAAFASPERPRIAVLPFVNMSDDPRAKVFADGLAEEVLTKLTRQRWLAVAARNVSLAYLRTTPDVGQVGSELGVRYLLKGSVRQIEDQSRIAVRLIDAVEGIHIWADCYDCRSVDRCSIHDNVIEAIVSAVPLNILRVERGRALRKLPSNLDAWEAYQRGMWHMSNGEQAENALAQGFFQRAIDLDPGFAAGYGALAWSHMMAASIFSHMPIAEGCVVAEPLLRRAVALDENDLEARARLAIAALLQGDFTAAFESAQQVLAVKDTCAEALGVKGAVLVYSGRGEEGRTAIHQHLILSRNDPARPIRLSQLASSLYLDGKYQDAANLARQVVRQYPRHPVAYRWLAAALGQLGRTAEAEEVLEHLRTTAPLSLDMYIRHRPAYCSIEHAPMLAGLRKAGWKE